jgi:hypothetical protein
MAARIAKTFSIDPVMILNDDGDDLINSIRLAAAQIVNDDERKAAEESTRSAPRRSSSRRR